MKRRSIIAVAVTGAILGAIMAMCGGCFLTPTFQRLGITDDFAATQAKAYIKQAMKDKGIEYATDKQVDAVFDAARTALEASDTFQESAKEISENEAVVKELNTWSQKIIDSGVVVPAPTNTVTQ
jgi:hypothetical protein